MAKIKGINVHIPTTMQIDKAIACGFDWIRLDFSWNVIEPKKGKYNWNAIDNAVNYAIKKGLSIYGTIAYSPVWLNADYHECPASKDEWIYFVSKCAARYLNKINHWGLWNEPNLKQFYVGSKSDYLETILKAGSIALRKVSGNITIVAGDLATTSSSDWPDWFKLLYKNHTLFDVFAWHTYQDDTNTIESRYIFGKLPPIGWIKPEYRPFSWYLDKFREHEKMIWLTETGWKAPENSSSKTKQQSKNIKTLASIQKDIDADLIFLYELVDDPNINDKWGVFSAEYNPKPSAQWLIENNH